jgi:hypothetical protein
MPLTVNITTGLSKLVWSAMEPRVESHVKEFLTND